MLANASFRILAPCTTAIVFATWLLACGATSQATDAGKKQDAETVYVAVETAHLFAGPSKDYYPTSNSKRGTPLEVYHRTADGWLGVRPPDSSFSWVPASQAYLLPGGRSIEITDAKAVSWIGTELGSAKQYRWQVQLNLGEQLKVLGESSVANGTEAREALWYKVAPPDGEFRWIEQSAVTKTPPEIKKPTTSESQSKAKEESPKVVTASTQGTANNGTANNRVENASYAQPVQGEQTNAQMTPARAVVQNSSGQIKNNSTRNNANASHIRNNHSNGPKKRSTNDFEGWYAFEMNDSGMRFPFLDKLSGRDRGNASQGPRVDPLAHDPFSLAMQDQPSTNNAPASLPSKSTRPNGDGREMLANNSAGNNAARSWRDPRTLKSRRGQGALQMPEKDPVQFANVMDEPSSGIQANGVGQANYVSTTPMSAAPSGVVPNDLIPPDVNWQGYQPPNTVGTADLRNPMTASADAAELQLALNQTVSQPTTQWNLEPLAERARYLIEHGANAVERGQARLLMDRIDEFRSVAARSQGLPVGALPTNYGGNSANPAINSVAPTTSMQQSNNGQAYDATGWLVPVHSTSPDQPTHAITNDAGDVIAYVSGMAGMNLEHYRNQPVGIIGLRGYLPQLKTPHIQAQRVTRLRP